MSLVAPEEGWVWLSVPLSEAVDVTVVGELHSWFTHWYRGPLCKQALAVRCVREERGCCDWCTAGYDRRVRYVFPVQHEGDVRLVELGRVQYPALASITQFNRWIGCRIRLVRERPVKNAPIQVRRVGEELVSSEAQVDCSGYVAALGMTNLRMLDSQGALSDLPPHALNGSGRLRR